MAVTIFGIHLNINPIAFTIPLWGGKHWDVYWYGILIALGFLLALIYAYITAPKFGINIDAMLDAILVTVPVSILSARAYYVIFDGEKLSGIGDFFGFGESSGFSGLAIYGAVIGAFVAGGIMCRIKKINLLDMFDITVTAFLIGQGIGRWGNFINQEAFGTLTGSSWWGMESERTVDLVGEGMVHPCFLYESIWCIAGFFILNHLLMRKKFKGQNILCYGIWYGFGRGIIETIRTDSLMIGSLRVSCLLSFTACIISAVLMIIILKRKKQNSEGEAYEKLFDENDEDEITENENTNTDTENSIVTEEENSEITEGTEQNE